MNFASYRGSRDDDHRHSVVREPKEPAMRNACLCCAAAALLGPVVAAGLMYIALMYAPDLPDWTF